MPELVVDPVTSAGDLRRALSPGQADEHGEYDGDRLTVDDDATAEELVETYPNVRWADDTLSTDTYPDEAVGRAELDEDGTTYVCGVNDCSREVDSPTDTCWQHTDGDDEERADERADSTDDAETDDTDDEP
jgi:hypothetical protein